MISARFSVLSLDAAHQRTAFHSGSEPLDRYLREQAGQDMRRHVIALTLFLPMATVHKWW